MNPVTFFKCLADETRLRCLLMILQETELCVCELTTALGESQPKISRHLAQLRQCGLLLDRRQGVWMHYRIHPDLPIWAVDVLKNVLNENRDFLQQNIQQLCHMGDRPERQQVCC